ncbi:MULTISPECIES: hypothetical protein [Azospirillum]|uniref:Uncharacterized protein n=1 Tax=Azospirillum brasilense TaxID=192 RepID=A0ABU4P1H0_AZOBR|nr:MULTISPECIES: hypothetical protein [Azospirillum]MDW7557881.1 hypothetical protein [Azospirillum brasilense]MDW7597486.1 hypothetical protein [Azospirillum brasilense]MDW7632679.1 hypothetical protein [Azospirillum brasilense]MDX5950189.1 hypothetical protein [Azospirillum brasilense]OPH11941.1 hypothetical protein FE89_30965 [Azospirillum brasilense]
MKSRNRLFAIGFGSAVFAFTAGCTDQTTLLENARAPEPARETEAVGLAVPDVPPNVEPLGPTAIAPWQGGQTLVLDPPAAAIQVLGPDGMPRRPIKLTGVAQPTDMVVEAGFIYVLDAALRRVVKLDGSGRRVDVLAVPATIDLKQAKLSVPAADDVQLELADGTEAPLTVQRGPDGDLPGGAKLATPHGPVAWRFARVNERTGRLSLSNLPVAPKQRDMTVEGDGILSAAELVHVDSSQRLYILIEELLKDRPVYEIRMTVLRYAPDGSYLDAAPLPLANASRLPNRFLSFAADGTTSFIKIVNKKAVTVRLTYAVSRGVGETAGSAVPEPMLDDRETPFEAYVRSLAPVERGAAGPVSRDEMEQIARSLLDERFVLSRANYGRDDTSVCAPAQNRMWLRPARLNGQIGATVQSIPYKWGGHSDLFKIREDLRNGKLAGDICTCRAQIHNYCITPQSSGLDCSGFVAQVWRSPYHETSSLHKISNPVPRWEDLRKGDILNLAGSHVRVFLSLRTDGFYRVKTMESAVSCGGVCESSYRLGALIGYRPLRYRDVTEVAAQ